VRGSLSGNGGGNAFTHGRLGNIRHICGMNLNRDTLEEASEEVFCGGVLHLCLCWRVVWRPACFCHNTVAPSTHMRPQRPAMGVCVYANMAQACTSLDGLQLKPLAVTNTN
jgi:hypothetical protein